MQSARPAPDRVDRGLARCCPQPFPPWPARRARRPAPPASACATSAPRDAAAREALLDASFGPSRFAKTCERLREGRLAAEGLSFVAADGGAVVGTLRFWHVECGRAPALMLGPLAVAASHRSAGIGAP